MEYEQANSNPIEETIDNLADYGKELLKEMVTYDTTSSDRHVSSNDDFINYFTNELCNLGFNVEILEKTTEYDTIPVTYKTILASVENEAGPHYVLCGHYDVAGDDADWDKFTPVESVKEWQGEDRGIIYGKGTNDMKAGVVSQLLAVKSLMDNNAVKGKVSMMFVPDEEISGYHGADYALKTIIADRKETIDGALICEPTTGRVVTRRRAMANYDIGFSTQEQDLEESMASYSISITRKSSHNAHVNREDPHALYDLADIVGDISKDIDIYFSSLNGGSAKNTTPTTLTGEVSIHQDNIETFEAMLNMAGIEYESIKSKKAYMPAITDMLGHIRELRKVDIPHLDGSEFGVSVGPNVVHFGNGNADITLDMRILQPKVEIIDSVITSVFDGAHYVDLKGFAAPLNQDPNNDFIKTVTEKTQHYIDYRDDIASGENPGQSDSKHFVDWGNYQETHFGKNLPVCEVGGVGANIHGKDEYVYTHTMIETAKIVAASLEELMKT